MLLHWSVGPAAAHCVPSMAGATTDRRWDDHGPDDARSTMAPTSWPALRGGALALLAAGLFGISTPLVQRAGQGLGPLWTAALLYAGAALVGLLTRPPPQREAEPVFRPLRKGGNPGRGGFGLGRVGGGHGTSAGRIVNEPLANLAA